EGHSCADRARLAACAEAMDRTHPGHDEAPSSRGEHRRGVDRTYTRRSPSDRQRRIKDPGARRTLSGKLPETGQSLMCRARRTPREISTEETQNGNQTSWLSTIWQGTLRLVHRHGADRSAFSGS